MTTGEKIRKLRKTNRLTQQEMADKLGVGLSTFKRYETGVALPRLAILKAIAYEFRCTVDDLTDDEQAEHNEVAEDAAEPEWFGAALGRKLKDEGRSVKWLSKKTGIPAPTIYSMTRRGSKRVDTLTALRIIEAFPAVAGSRILNEVIEKAMELKKELEEE